MTELLTAAQMRAIEQAAIDSGEVTGLELMERAGRGVVDAILDWRPELATAPHRAVVLCGPGNNGGDGFVVARLLHQRGWDVEVYLYGAEAKLPPDAAENARLWRELGEVFDFEDLVETHGWDSETNLCFEGHAVVFIDAVFGTGLSRALADDLSEFLCDVQNHSNAHLVAIDLPSGVCADSGKVLLSGAESESSLEYARGFDISVSFHRAKIGHLLSLASQSLRVAGLGIETHHWKYRSELRGERLRARRKSLPVPEVPVTWIGAIGPKDPLLPVAAPPPIGKHAGNHKYNHGHALIFSGGVGKGGAARLAARGALRIGAGLVTVGCPPAAVIENAARLDAVMLTSISDAEALTAEIADRKIKALCIGPGFGTGERLRAFLETGLKPGLPAVLDADALTEYREDPDTLFAMLHEGCVLTPHEGEFGRLFPDILAKLTEPATKGPAYSKVDATREAAKRAGCVVLFKGADTVIAQPDGRCAINSAHYERAAPWLATAGSGDVLAGFITGLLARGFAPMQAAEIAAWLHVECARKFGPGLIAEDLPEQLPAVFRDLEL